MMERLMDGLWPTRRQPAPVIESAGELSVLLDRVVAAVIDLTVCFVLVEAPVVYLLGELFPAAYDALGGFVVLATLLALLPIYATYSFAFEWRYGRTPGKVNRGLLVVTADGDPCTLQASAVRNLSRYIDLLGVPPLVLGLLVMLATDGRRIGDVLAVTVVVRSTAPAEREGVVTPDLETSAASRAKNS